MPAATSIAPSSPAMMPVPDDVLPVPGSVVIVTVRVTSGGCPRLSTVMMMVGVAVAAGDRVGVAEFAATGVTGVEVAVVVRGVALAGGVDVGVAVAVGEPLTVVGVIGIAVLVEVRVAVLVAVEVAVLLPVGVDEGNAVEVGVFVDVGTAVCVAVFEATGVAVPWPMTVADSVGRTVRVTAVFVTAVFVTAVFVTCVAVTAVFVRVTETVAVACAVWLGTGVSVGTTGQPSGGAGMMSFSCPSCPCRFTLPLLPSSSTVMVM